MLQQHTTHCAISGWIRRTGRKQSAERGVEKNGKMSQSTESSGFLRVKLMVFVFLVVGREWKTTYKKV